MPGKANAAKFKPKSQTVLTDVNKLAASLRRLITAGKDSDMKVVAVSDAGRDALRATLNVGPPPPIKGNDTVSQTAAAIKAAALIFAIERRNPHGLALRTEATKHFEQARSSHKANKFQDSKIAAKKAIEILKQIPDDQKLIIDQLDIDTCEIQLATVCAVEYQQLLDRQSKIVGEAETTKKHADELFTQQNYHDAGLEYQSIIVSLPSVETSSEQQKTLRQDCQEKLKVCKQRVDDNYVRVARPHFIKANLISAACFEESRQWSDAKEGYQSAAVLLRTIAKPDAQETEQLALAADGIIQCERQLQAIKLTTASAPLPTAQRTADNKKVTVEEVKDLKNKIKQCFATIDGTVKVIGKSKKSITLKQLKTTQTAVETVRANVQNTSDKKALKELLTRLQSISGILDAMLVRVKKEKSVPVKPKKPTSSGSRQPAASEAKTADVEVVYLSQVSDVGSAGSGSGAGKSAEVTTSKSSTLFFAAPPAVTAVRPAQIATAAPAMFMTAPATASAPAVVDSKQNAMTVVLSPPPNADVKHAVMTAGVTDKEKLKREIKNCFEEITNLIGIKVVGDKFFADDSKGFAKYYWDDYRDEINFTLEFMAFNQQCLLPYHQSQKATASIGQLKTILSNFTDKRDDLLRIQNEMLNPLPDIEYATVHKPLILTL